MKKKKKKRGTCICEIGKVTGKLLEKHERQSLIALPVVGRDRPSDEAFSVVAWVASWAEAKGEERGSSVGEEENPKIQLNSILFSGFMFGWFKAKFISSILSVQPDWLTHRFCKT
jgi:hypothetical protein